MKSFVLVAGMLTLLASPAMAQSADSHPAATHTATMPVASVFGGYSLSRDDSETFNGWAASVQFHVNEWFAIGGETSGHYKSHAGVDASKNSFLAGPRFSKHIEGSSVVPFAYVLGGIERASASVGSVSTSENDFAMAFGGGLDIHINHQWAFAIEADDLMARSHGSNHWTPRVSVGFVFNIGEK